MPRHSRIHRANIHEVQTHQVKAMSHVSHKRETDQSSYDVIHDAIQEAGGAYRAGEFAMISDTAVAAIFAPCKAWLRMVQQYNAEILKTYEEVFWTLPALSIVPLELVRRSFALSGESQEYRTESIGQQGRTASPPALRIERSDSRAREAVNSIERAMDIVIGAESEESIAS